MLFAVSAVLRASIEFTLLAATTFEIVRVTVAVGDVLKINVVPWIELVPAFVKLVAHHRNKKLNDLELKDIFPLERRQPEQLQHYFTNWKRKTNEIRLAPPSLVFAVIAQAKADKKIGEALEGRLLKKMLTQWAFMTSENRTKKEGAKIANELQQLINI